MHYKRPKNIAKREHYSNKKGGADKKLGVERTVVARRRKVILESGNTPI